jgi:replication initiation protein RepC
MAEGFAGMPDGVTVPGQLLAALKAAAPRLGLSPRLVHAVDWLFRFTQPQDWGRGGRPIVWPSASVQQEALGLSPTRTKAANRALIEAGLVTMKDSPNGKRYGKRDPKGRIVEAYGFDLSPIAMRYAEFVRLAAEAKAEREELRRLRRRATIARNGIAQILETAAEYGFQGEEWTRLGSDVRDIARGLRTIERPEEVALGVDNLERRQRLARERLENLLSMVAGKAPDSVNPDPMGSENGPHQYTYKLDSYPEQDTVIAPEDSSSAGGEDNGPIPAPARQEPAEKGRVLKLGPDQLVRLAPRLKLYLRRPDPTWPEVIDAAAFLRSDLDVSKSLWGEACLAMGRHEAAIAIAIVSTKDPEHFRTTPGGYFHGMVAKAKAGELNLDRTLWGMRCAADPRPGKAPAGQGVRRDDAARPA